MTLQELKQDFRHHDYLRGEHFDFERDEMWIELKSGNHVCINGLQLRLMMMDKILIERWECVSIWAVIFSLFIGFLLGLLACKIFI
jgi:hypothetical protein